MAIVLSTVGGIVLFADMSRSLSLSIEGAWMPAYGTATCDLDTTRRFLADPENVLRWRSRQ